MNLFRFILGILGILIIIAVFSQFLPLLFLGRLVSGNILFAFGFSILLVLLGIIMVYFGFYYIEPIQNSNAHLINLMKWGVFCTIAIYLSNYVLIRLAITNNLLEILFTSLIVSLVVQVVKSHDSHNFNFKLKWSIFYFLVYSNIIWLVKKYVIQGPYLKNNLFSLIIIGFSIAGVYMIIQKINIKDHSVNMISSILVILLLVANLESLNSTNIPQFLEQGFNSSEFLKDKQICPIPNTLHLPQIRTEAEINPTVIMPTLANLINTSTWRIESNTRFCNKGQYRGQYPDWIYCDDMIVSRWETSSSGTIEYRWYTAISVEWKPTNGKYTLDKFSCEGGKKVVVDKKTPEIYSYDSKDGTVININVLRDSSHIETEY